MSDRPQSLAAGKPLDDIDISALRNCAAICWQRRAELELSDAQIDQVLIAWMAVGTIAEATAASELLAARREADRKQDRFDGLLGGT